ncbi:ribonuclease P protein component [Skermania sp. ID1734]|uniref:ribonuclease P protein component n=1 Tax=Skermania sp. ID1734 TaxID=2597516 RepID=UPI00117BF8ED|nr:ribonuclease P protein component [Skermania sp. ID1734]TSD99255.1 ribonuclease P protein component [Skermania sp. ID1734]
MLPEPHRLHHHSDFSRTVRRGHRIGRRYFVVYALDRATADLAVDAGLSVPVLGCGNPRFGLIVSKSVGNAVVRHRVARRLRHVYAALLPNIRPEVDVVVRALPPAAAGTSAEFARDLSAALRRLRVLADGGGTP